MAEDPKDTIYIDVDDEITTIIDKVSASDKKLVALVLPKRASVFQSIVNMKLLKRKSDEAGKHIVLVSSDTDLLPLAGAVGVYVAKTLASPPAIPAAPIINPLALVADEGESLTLPDEEPDTKAEKTESTGLKQAALDDIGKDKPASKPVSGAKAVEDTIELDNSDEAIDGAAAKAGDKTEPSKDKSKKQKGLKVPNFERFRLALVLGGIGIVVLIVLLILMLSVWPKATIDIKTNSENVAANVSFNLSTSAGSFDLSTATVPAKNASETKTYTATVNATGQQNNGQPATGSVVMTATVCPSDSSSDSNYPLPESVAAGTGIVQNNLTYITQTNTAFSSHGKPSSGGCIVYTQQGNTAVTAQQPGTNYNTSSNNTSFSVSGQPETSVTAIGGASGGSDNVVTIVSQTDINNATSKITTNSSGAKSDLTSQLTDANYFPLSTTFTAGSPTTSANATAGTVANSVTVTETVAYTMYGAIKSDLSELINSSIHSQVGSGQDILSNGIDSASYQAGSSPTNLTLSATAIVGPDINVSALKKEITGEKSQQIISSLKTNPSVSSVNVYFSPFYVSKAPSPSKITINVAKPTNST